MKEKNLTKHLLNQVGDLLQKIQNHDKPIGDISPEFIKQLEILEKTFKQYEELNDKTQKEANIDIEALRLEFYRSPSIHSKDKKLIDKLKTIEKDARQLQAVVAKSLGSQAVLSKKDKIIKERRRKFKSMGGEKGWIRL